MKLALALVVAVVALGLSNVSFAADRAPAGGNVSQNLLADMGLGDMQVMSDQEGQAVKGKAAWLVFLFPSQPLNPAQMSNFIIQQGLNATVHFPSFKGFYVAPTPYSL
jgi:hypothetical protein